MRPLFQIWSPSRPGIFPVFCWVDITPLSWTVILSCRPLGHRGDQRDYVSSAKTVSPPGESKVKVYAWLMDIQQLLGQWNYYKSYDSIWRTNNTFKLKVCVSAYTKLFKNVSKFTFRSLGIKYTIGFLICGGYILRPAVNAWNHG